MQNPPLNIRCDEVAESEPVKLLVSELKIKFKIIKGLCVKNGAGQSVSIDEGVINERYFKLSYNKLQEISKAVDFNLEVLRSTSGEKDAIESLVLKYLNHKFPAL